MPPVIIFDLDGTLIDSVGDIALALNRLLEQEGRPHLAIPQIQSLIGEGVNVLIDGAWAMTGEPLSSAEIPALVERYLALYAQEPATHTVLYDGIFPMLDTFRSMGWRIGICTNKPDVLTAQVLNSLGIAPRLDGWVGGDFPLRKPNGAHVLEAVARLGGTRDRAIYVGDSETDVKAARHAGIPVICVSHGYHHGKLHQLGADHIVDHVKDLPASAGQLLG